MRPATGVRLWAEALLLAMLTGTSAILMEGLGKIPFGSDQAIVGLMALDILERGKHPVFCYGSHYAGTLEAHLLAVAFWVFGASVTTFRAVTLTLTLLLVLTVWATVRRFHSARAGLFAGLVLAAGPAYLHSKCLTSDGDYVSFLLTSAVAALALREVELRVRTGRPAATAAAAFGAALGVDWWLMPLTSAVIAACGLALVVTRQRRMIALLPVTAAAAVVGALPWIAYNVRSGWVSLSTGEMALASPAEMLANLQGLFRIGWPIVLGCWHVWQLRPPLVSVVFATGLLLSILAAAAIHWRRESDPGRSFGIVLSIALVVVPAAISLLARRTDFREPRYLLACYLGLAALVGIILDSAWDRPSSRVPLVAIVSVLGLFNLGSAPPLRDLADGPWDRVAAELRRRGVTEYYGSYWLVYRTTFLSHGQLVGSPFGSATHGYVRDLGALARLSAAKDPAFVLCCEDRSSFDRYLSQTPLAFEGTSLGVFRLYRHLAPEVLERLRQNPREPFPVPARGG